MRTQREIEAALLALGWTLDGPRRTSGGWKATIRRGTVSMLATGPTAQQVLEDLILYAQKPAKTLEHGLSQERT